MNVLVKRTVFIWFLVIIQGIQVACKAGGVEEPKAVNQESESQEMDDIQDSTAIIDSDDPFEPYLFTLPEEMQAISSYNSGSGIPAITTEKFIFKSKDNINTVYAITAFPQRKGVYPAILVLHGGGGNAEGLVGMVEQYARLGYVAMALDLPGICGTQNTPNSKGLWKVRPSGEEPRFEVEEGPENSTLVDGIVAAIQGFNLLRTRTDVDNERIGVTGFSWGGYTTTMMAGLMRDRVKAAYSVYGSGFYEKDSFWKERILKLPASVRETWLKYLDAGRRATFITAPYFIEAASNDTYFQPEAVMATINSVPGIRNQVWAPNLNHSRIEEGGDMQIAYFDQYLKNAVSSFFTVAINKTEVLKDQSKKVFIKVDIQDLSQIEMVELYYSEPDSDWTKRNWISIKASLSSDGNYFAVIPAEIADKEINYYAHVSGKGRIKISSLIY